MIWGFCFLKTKKPKVLQLLAAVGLGGRAELRAWGGPGFAGFASLHLFLVLRTAEIAVGIGSTADKGNQKAEGGQTSDHFGHGFGLQVVVKFYPLGACPRRETEKSQGWTTHDTPLEASANGGPCFG